MEYERFFAELVPRLDSARVLERELDRKLAHRFNVLDYLREDELGLSRIIADLLNPKARHGQEKLFLQTLLSLGGLKNTPHWPNLDRSQISVDVERVITADRRIDISVQIVGADGETYCLAIENKPYADDQENQVKDYLEYLRKEKKYDERFLLIYISGTGKGPSEWSIHKTELDKWEGRFAIMPYCGGQEEQAGKFKDFRIPHSLADWLGECRKNCEVDRLRWFLRDAETFCQRTFGGQAMITDSEKKAAIDYMLLNQSNLQTALAVHESWPDVKARICKKFLNQLCSRIEAALKKNETLKGFAGDMRIDNKYEDKPWKSYVYLYRECWIQYPNPVEQKISRTNIRLSNEYKGPNGWGFSVSSPMPRSHMAGEYKERRLRLDTDLVSAFGYGGNTDDCPWWWNKVDEDKRNWNSLIPDLHQECEGQSDEITKYFVNKFTEIAGKAIPVINGIERLS